MPNHDAHFNIQPSTPLLAPSILSADFGHIERDCQLAMAWGADWLHLDVMDGHFVPNLSFGVDMLKAVRRAVPDGFLDVHLMVERPDQLAPAFIAHGANLISFHVETTRTCRGHAGIDGHALLSTIRHAGVRTGLVINPDTPVEALTDYLPSVDLLLIMSVRPGFSGQAFMPTVLHKVRWLTTRLSTHQRIQMDGGVGPATAAACVAAGADVLVAASALFGSQQPAQAAASMKALRCAR